MRAKTALLTVLAVLAVLSASAGPARAVKYFWQVALEEIEGSMQHAYAEKFVETLEQAAQGAVRCKIHVYGELGTSGEITELLQSGNLQFAFQSPGHLGSYIPEVQVFSIHYLFPTDFGQLEKILRKGPHTYRALQKYYRRNRLDLLSIIEEGWQIWTANKPIRKPADFKGVTFRVMSSPPADHCVSALRSLCHHRPVQSDLRRPCSRKDRRRNAALFCHTGDEVL